jgi:hypothetical protein
MWYKFGSAIGCNADASCQQLSQEPSQPGTRSPRMMPAGDSSSTTVAFVCRTGFLWIVSSMQAVDSLGPSQADNHYLVRCMKVTAAEQHC